jgi:hypothetical protein
MKKKALALYAMTSMYGNGSTLFISALLIISIAISAIITLSAIRFGIYLICGLFIVKTIYGAVFCLRMLITGEVFFYGDFTYYYKAFYFKLQKEQQSTYKLMISLLNAIHVSLYVCCMVYLFSEIFALSCVITVILVVLFFIISVILNTLLGLEVFKAHQTCYHDDCYILLTCISGLLDTFYFVYKSKVDEED